MLFSNLMLKLSARSEYGLLLVKYLADHVGIFPLKDISNELWISEPILRKVSQQLVARWICVSQKGRNGGVGLIGWNPSLFEVLQAMDEDMKIALCTRWSECNQQNECRISPTLKRLQHGMEALLKITKI